ncbi:MAG TPA: GDP-mannose 4,6-dehydratase, partial [Polyangia bacterium]|nr:GDP-mannose 4,6-dehydratase [Polyangia bacterium]
PDGTAIRDYVHVADLADAHVLALGHLAGGGASFAANVGTGTGHSVREVITSVERIGGREVARREVARRAGDSPELVADPRRIQALLGWRPRHAALDVMVEHAWKWRTRDAR